jgi:hypothetical protein
MKIAAYVYPGWHPIPERDRSFYPGFTEWDLVEQCRPRFEDHVQPRLPALGRYDDRDPREVERRLALARDHGVDAFIYGTFWCRGKRVFEDALDLGFLGSAIGREAPFAVMWANRMPRRVLPVLRPEAPLIDPAREVSSDVADFVQLIEHLADRYFRRPNYLRLAGVPYFSIFDSTYFVRDLGFEDAKRAIGMAKARLVERGFGGLHLAAIDPAADVIGRVKDLGFDSVTHYVLLPYWKGPTIQDYATVAEQRAGEWSSYAAASDLPYHPSVAPGWDASPRGADFGATRPDKYPWSPVVTGEHPLLFRAALERALAYPSPLTMIASLNEWSEGHYLEPDDRFGLGWLEAVRASRATIDERRDEVRLR